MSMQNKDWLCHILASITIVLWASSYVLTPYALQSYSPTALSLLRYMFGAAALVIFGCIKRIGLPKLRDVPKFFLAGALGITVYMVAYNIGAQTLSGTTCSVVLAHEPGLHGYSLAFPVPGKNSVFGLGFHRHRLWRHPHFNPLERRSFHQYRNPLGISQRSAFQRL